MSDEAPHDRSRWPQVFSDFIRALPTTKLTAAQTANLLADAMGLGSLFLYVMLGGSELGFLAAMAIWFLFTAWCVSTTRPKR